MNELRVKNNKEIKKIYSAEETKNIILNHGYISTDIPQILRDLGKETISKFINGTEDEKKLANKELSDKAVGIFKAFENDTRFSLMESFDESYRGFAKELCDQISKDYKCTTSIEKALVGNIVNAHIRTMDCSRRLNNDLYGPGQTITEVTIKYLAMLSKQIDRSNRQFLSALMTLKQLKAPIVEMNIKTTNAFVSQNQQINTSNEINASK